MADDSTLGGTQAEASQDVRAVPVVENPETVAHSYYAPRTNTALQLAASLSQISPEVNGALTAYAQVQQQNINEKTKAAAIASNGAGFAEAVRRGLIEPTQNPWYMRSYAKNAAAVNTQNQTAQLNTVAATWAEQNDPAAFQQKYSQALAQIGAQYKTPWEQEGYNAAAAPALQQAVAQNQAYNVNRIKTERQQDISSLAGKALMDAIKANGGRPDVEKAIAAVAPMKADWLASGGTITDWNKVLVGSIQDAAFRVQDPSVLELAKGIPNNAGGSLYDMEGTARDLTQTGYMIERETRDKIRLQMQGEEFATYQKTQGVESDLFSAYGPDVYSGKIPLEDTIKPLIAKGYTASEIGTAYKAIAEASNAIREIGANRYSGFAQSSQGAAQLNQLYGVASTKGWTPELEQDLGVGVLAGNWSATTAEEIRAKAIAHTPTQGQHLNSDITKWVKADADLVNAVAKSEVLAHKHGAPSLSTQESADLEQYVRNTVTTFAQQNPTIAAEGAQTIAAGAIIQWWTRRATQYKGGRVQGQGAPQ